MKPLNQIAFLFVITSALTTAAHGDGFLPTGWPGYLYNDTATLLPNGKVLVAGGQGFVTDSNGDPSLVFLDTAQLYDPATGTWTSTGSLHSARAGHTATLLPNGKVLVAGGFRIDGGYFIDITFSELYDPATGSWSYAGAGAGRGHTATLLPSGKVLFTGGEDGNGNVIKGAWLYDPITDTETITGSPHSERVDHMATLLLNGKVLVQGGTTNSAELYNPTNGTWTTTGNPVFKGETATLLPNGKVLVVGTIPDGFGNFLPGAELYDPTNGTWTTTGTPGGSGTATLLLNGKVLLVEGATAELYDPATGTWSPTGGQANGAITATRLTDGKVLLIGSSSAELYESFLNPILNPVRLGDGSIQFRFSNLSGPGYRVLASPDLAAPLNTWSNLGAATETPPGSGQFQFTDHQAPNYPQRFYRVSSP